ncbi:MAG: MFS transporter, partial [Bryobacterales bacterium]|nr:MFS transporter [Bryobacterales bacterium]
MKPAHVWMVALMFGFSVASYFERTILSVAAPLMMKEFDLSPTSMGMVFSSFQLSYTLLMTPGGRWSDRFGPRNTLGVGCFGAALFTSLLPLARGIPVLAAMRFIFGIFTAPLYPACGHMTSLHLPASQHTRVFGIVNAGAGVGGAISPLL